MLGLVLMSLVNLKLYMYVPGYLIDRSRAQGYTTTTTTTTEKQQQLAGGKPVGYLFTSANEKIIQDY